VNDRTDQNSDRSSPAAGPLVGLDADTERLLGLCDETWLERLRSAMRPPALGMFGPYELIAEIGRGGQGEVYKARQPGTGRLVAIKRIAGLGLAPDPSLLARFTREVEALTRLSHPHVVTVHSMEVIGGHSLLVMELVEGKPIDSWADDRWAASGDGLRPILACFAAACDGVAHAHQRGVIHRDIKPANILVTADGSPKVLDFGIARLLKDEAARGASARWSVTGFAGTPAYASPEQLAPGVGGIDTRSDVFSLGVLLFRLLTGRDAFQSTRGASGLMSRADETVTGLPSRLRPGLPGECDWIVRQATDPEPGRRYQSADALAEDVRRVLDGRPVAAHPPSALYSFWRTVRRWPRVTALLVITGSAVLVLGVVAGVQAVSLKARTRELAAALEAANAHSRELETAAERRERLNSVLMKTVVGAISYPAYLFIQEDGHSVASLAAVATELTPEDGDEINCEVNARLGYGLRSLRRYEEAARHLGIAAAISERIDDPSRTRAVHINVQWSLVHRAMRKPREALTIIDSAIERAASRPPSSASAGLWWERLHVLHALGVPDEEFLEYASRTRSYKGTFPEWNADIDRYCETVAEMALARGLEAEGERWAREAVAQAEAGHGTRNTIYRTRTLLIRALVAQGKWEEAEPIAAAESAARLRNDSGSDGSTHSMLRRHAEILHHLGRFKEAAVRWELCLIRPLAAARRDQVAIAGLRFRLAAALLGSDQRAQALMELARAVSKDTVRDPADPRVAAGIERCIAALREADWRADEKARLALGDLGWLVGKPPAAPLSERPSAPTDEEP